MSPDSELDTNRYRYNLPRVVRISCILIRTQRLQMSNSLSPDPPAHSSGENPQVGDWQQLLFNGLDNGFKRLETGINQIMVNLSKVEDKLSAVPGKTATALETQRSFINAEHRAVENVTDSGANRMENELAVNIEQLRAENELLQAQLNSAYGDIETRAMTETRLKEELAQRGREIARLQLEKAKFRDIILGNAGTQKVTDQEVIQVFSDLRQNVQQLASSKVFNVTSAPVLPSKDVYTPRTRQFYTDCRHLRGKDIINRVKSRLFILLHWFILDRTCFGLKRETKEGKNNPELWQMEEGLASFELHLLKNSAVNGGMIADWRTCTLDCIKQLGLKEEYSRYVAAYIERFLAPLLSKHASKKEQDELWDKILEVCRKCIVLQNMIQRSKEGYLVMNLDQNKYPSVSTVSHLAEVMAVENGRATDASTEVAYFLFGALTKHNKQLGGESKTLVKAEVILKRKLGK